MYRWNGADGKQIGKDSEDCEILQHVRLFWKYEKG